MSRYIYCKYSGYCPYKHFKRRKKKKEEYTVRCLNDKTCNQVSYEEVVVSKDDIVSTKKKRSWWIL